MKRKIENGLDIDLIGSLESLTKEEEKLISEFLKQPTSNIKLISKLNSKAKT